jgi:hypothetical protein
MYRWVLVAAVVVVVVDGVDSVELWPSAGSGRHEP